MLSASTVSQFNIVGKQWGATDAAAHEAATINGKVAAAGTELVLALKVRVDVVSRTCVTGA